MLGLFWITVSSSKILQEFVSRTFVMNFSIQFFQNLLEVTELIFIIDFIQFSEKKIIFNLN